jgi:hypothetical protein
MLGSNLAFFNRKINFLVYSKKRMGQRLSMVKFLYYLYISRNHLFLVQGMKAIDLNMLTRTIQHVFY